MSNSELNLNLLGTPMLLVDNQPVPLSPRTALLCAYLALSPPGGRLRSTVAAQFFADCPVEAARRRLNTALWRLQAEVRSRTGVELVGRPGNQCLALSPAAKMRIDAVVFEDQLAPVLARAPGTLSLESVARIEGALALHRGPLIQACDDDWVLTARHRIETLYVTALDYLIQHHGARGDLGAVGRYADLALTVEPLREDIHRHVMTAYAGAGRLDLVERQFEQCRLVVLTELGADPMPETLELYGRLTGGDGASGFSVPGMVAELEHARRELTRLGTSIDRVLDRLYRL